MILESHRKGWADFTHEFLKGNNLLVGRKSWARTYTKQYIVYSEKRQSFGNSLKVVVGKSGQICCPCIKQELVNIFSKGPDSIIHQAFLKINLYRVCPEDVTLLFHCENSHRQCMNEWVWLCSNTTSFIKTVGEFNPELIVWRPMTPVGLLISPI